MNKGLFLLIIGFILLSSCDKKTNKVVPVRPVKAVVVGVESNFIKRSFPGRAQAIQEVDLSFKIPGLLVALPVLVGDKVIQGQSIGTLDSREFVARLNSAQADAKRDDANFKRGQQLIKSGNISQVDFELLKSKATISQANVALAEKALNDTVIRAPFTGRIVSVPVKNHQTVAPNQTIARLLDTTHIEMVLQIPETTISVVHLLKNIRVQFDAFPHLLIPATIKEISYEASTETRTYPVTLVMQQPAAVEILPGMAGNATGSFVPANTTSKRLFTIPAAALFSVGSEKKTYVWLIDKHTYKVHQQPVKLGELTPTGVTVTQGIKQGELVVIAGVHSLQEGEVVSLLIHQDE